MQAQLARIFGSNPDPVQIVDEGREPLETEETPSIDQVNETSQHEMTMQSEINIAQADRLDEINQSVSHACERTGQLAH